MKHNYANQRTITVAMKCSNNNGIEGMFFWKLKDIQNEEEEEEVVAAEV